jgi:hypothetical protein
MDLPSSRRLAKGAGFLGLVMTDANKVEGVALEMIDLFGDGAVRIVRKHADAAAAGGDSPFAIVLCEIADAIERMLSSYGQAQLLTIR